MSHFGTKLTIWRPINSEATATTVLNPENMIDSTEKGVDIYIKQPEDFLPKTLMTTTELSQLNLKGAGHKRPMSDKEYQRYVEMIRDSKDERGNYLYKHDKAAIARVIKENFAKFFPGVAVDPIVNVAYKETADVDVILKDKYDKALLKFRDPFVVSFAHEVKDLYLPEEISRLRNLGIAFTGNAFKDFEIVQTMAPEITAKVVRGKQEFQHPLLKYNLVKGKK